MLPHNIKTTHINFSHTLIKPNCSSYSTAIFPRFFFFSPPFLSLSLFLSALPDVSLTIHHVTVSLFVSQQVGENVRSEHVFSSSTHLLNKRQEAPGAPSESRSLVKHCELKSLAPGEGGSCRFLKKNKKNRAQVFVPEAREASAPICNSKYDKYRGIRLGSSSPSRKSSAPSKRRERALPSDVRYPAAAGRRGKVCSLLG